MRIAVALVVAIGCGGAPRAVPAETCDAPEPGAAMTQAQCTCRDGNITLAVGRSVELHCDSGEVELGAVKLGDRAGWCCKRE